MREREKEREKVKLKSNKTQQQHTKPRKYNYSKKLPSFDIAIKFSFHPLSLASNSRRINSILAQDTKFLRARTCYSNYVHGFIFKFSRTKGLLHDTHTHTHTYIPRDVNLIWPRENCEAAET